MTIYHEVHTTSNQNKLYIPCDIICSNFQEEWEHSKLESQARMTTLFEETENTNPPSPSLGLLDTSSLKNELDAPARKVTTAAPTEAEGDLNSGNYYFQFDFQEFS